MAPEKSLGLYASLKGRTWLRLEIFRDREPRVVYYRSPEPLLSAPWFQQVCGASSTGGELEERSWTGAGAPD